MSITLCLSWSAVLVVKILWPTRNALKISQRFFQWYDKLILHQTFSHVDFVAHRSQKMSNILATPLLVNMVAHVPVYLGLAPQIGPNTVNVIVRSWSIGSNKYLTAILFPKVLSAKLV